MSVTRSAYRDRKTVAWPAELPPPRRCPYTAAGWLDIRVVEARVLAGSRLVAAVLTGTLGRSPVYRSWLARSVDIRAPDGQPIWLSVDGEVAAAESVFTQAKHPRGLIVYGRATSRPRTTHEKGRAPATHQTSYLLVS
jgi:hypothetical protein